MNINPLGLSILTGVILAVAFGSRRWALLATIAGALYLSQAERLTVQGITLFAYRFVELAAFLRVMIRSEYTLAKSNRVDRAVLWLYIYVTVVFLIRSKVGQAYAIGAAVDAFLCYFAFRGLIGGVDDFKWFLRAFLLLLVPYAALAVSEGLTGRNLFTALEGFDGIQWLREGRLRCQGSFRHPSLLGTLGASFIPLYVGLACRRTGRKAALIGIPACLAIVWAANSGAPVSCVIVGVAGWLLWGFRTRMRWLRRGTVAIVVVLAVVMKAPVWYLLAHVSDMTGGDGWHRSFLIDVAFRNIGKWWLAGMPILDTVHWFPYDVVSTGGADITNEFLSFGIQGGLVAILLFLRLLTVAYKNLGVALAESAEEADGVKFLLWGLGVMLAVHISNWVGITYFDQFYAIWFMQLAALVSLTEEVRARAAEMATDDSAPLAVCDEDPAVAEKAIATG
jgi:hypothetical protein